MQLFARLLADGHTSVIPPAHLRASENQPPLVIHLIEGARTAESSTFRSIP